jgi:hypothetical protein
MLHPRSSRASLRGLDDGDSVAERAMVIGVEHELCALHARGREAWAGVELDVATLSALAANQLDNGPFDDVRADDLYLAIACAARVKQAIIAFDKHYLPGLASALIRQGQDRAAAADVVQVVRVRFSSATQTAGRGSPNTTAAARWPPGSAWRRAAPP